MRFIWPDAARADLRAIQRTTAVHILHVLTRFGETGEGDVKALTGKWTGYSRLRIGEYRVIFLAEPERITIVHVRHRSEAYR